MRRQPKEDLRSMFAKKAQEGDGSFAIAWALMDLADAQEDTTRELGAVAQGFFSRQDQSK